MKPFRAWTPLIATVASPVLAVAAALLLACGSDPSGRPAANGVDAPSPEESAADASPPVIADVDPCALLSLADLQSAFPQLSEPGFPDPTNHQCVFSEVFVQLSPMTREAMETEHELFGLEPRPIEVPGADWAVARIDRGDGAAMEIVKALPEEMTGGAGSGPGDGEAPLVHDVIAVGPSGTLTLMPTGDSHPTVDSAEYEALVHLLRLGYDRL